LLSLSHFQLSLRLRFSPPFLSGHLLLAIDIFS
jgi:hypothetical protein